MFFWYFPIYNTGLQLPSGTALGPMKKQKGERISKKEPATKSNAVSKTGNGKKSTKTGKTERAKAKNPTRMNKSDHAIKTKGTVDKNTAKNKGSDIIKERKETYKEEKHTRTPMKEKDISRAITKSNKDKLIENVNNGG